MAGWTDLPLDILILIAQHVSIMEDFASFSAICKECRLICAMLKNKMSLPPRCPRLMFAENKHLPSVRGFLDLLTSTTTEVELPEAIGSFCLGAHYGWLFILGFDLQINLLHPLSRQKVALPTMLTLPDQFEYHEEFTPQMVLDLFVKKIAISASPLKENNLNNKCIIVAIYGEFRILAFARLGDTVWTNIKAPFKGYKDVLYYKGKFYAVDRNGVIVVCDIDDNNGMEATVVALAPCINNHDTQKYLVESSGDLLLVLRVPMLLELENGIEEDFDNGENEDNNGNNNIVDKENTVDNGSDKKERNPHYYSKERKPEYYTLVFTIWRLDECRESINTYPYKWTKLTTLGDRSLFLGRNVSASKVSSDGIKANCIYFTDDYEEFYYHEPDGGGWDTGIFNIEDGKIQFDYTLESLSKISPSLWYI